MLKRGTMERIEKDFHIIMEKLMVIEDFIKSKETKGEQDGNN